MKRLWVATEGIRYIMVCFLIMSVGMIWIIGCGGSSETPAEGGVAIESEESSEENEETWSEEIASYANELCLPHRGVKEILPKLERGWTEGVVVVVCEDGEVVPWETNE